MACLHALVALLAVLVAVYAVAGAAAQAQKGQPRQEPLTSDYRVVKQAGHSNQRVLAMSMRCPPQCKVGKCDKGCPADMCTVVCPSCKTVCLCDFYPGMVCGDPRFTGGDGNNFYFHGKKEQNFCTISDSNLHINAHFIGKRNPTMSRDFTWIQALGISFSNHRLYIGARKTVKWDSEVDRLELAFDNMPIDIPAEIGRQWQSDVVSDLTVMRSAMTNGVRVQLKGVFNIMANVVPITKEDSRIHNYGVTDDDSLVHLDISFKFHDLTDDVHGVLGQTYRTDYVNRFNVSASMPVMGGTANYLSSDIFSADCKVARFGRHAGISMVTATVN
ncbi:hypothetical protein CFC21_044821 [Triticum aestivum]|uniref:Uncharacterized protein n=2 Tax=Triticum aestivum TaxID=4565 RepID=A0A3B6FYU5_WHEAT|nr:uncharacterized protein LOC123068068 [Triticum aestivum]KAF7033747.1 hypothetical protein CFC21_044821 [Triticum aestivum]